jgi:5-methylcytosine-specific restriction endonuclease McrA
MIEIYDTVECAICKRKFKILSPHHLKQHGLSLSDYKKRYPDSPIRSQLAIKEQRIRDKAHSKRMAGKNNPFYGKKHSKEARLKISSGLLESFKYWRKHDPDSIGHPMPKGSKSASWSGGYVYGDKKYQSRVAALKFYGHMCMHPNCDFDLVVHCHHIVPRSIGGSYNLENCIILCPNHHAMADAGLIDVGLMKEIIGYFLRGDVVPAVPYIHKLWVKSRKFNERADYLAGKDLPKWCRIGGDK